MNIAFKPGAAKHGVTYEEAVYAITHAYKISTTPDDRDVHIFIGHPHQGALDDDWLEVLVRTNDYEISIFHAMPLTDKFRYLLYSGDTR